MSLSHYTTPSDRSHGLVGADEIPPKGGGASTNRKNIFTSVIIHID